MLIALVGSSLLLCGPTHSQAAFTPDCQSLTFTIDREGQKITFNVPELRKQRKELYNILESKFFQRASFGSDFVALARPLDLLAPLKFSKNLDDNQKMFWAFLGTDAIPTLRQEMLRSCGGFMDGIVAELSLKLSKTDGERLAPLLADPAFDRLSDVMPKFSTFPIPVELKPSIDEAEKRFQLSLIEKCKRFGVETATCEAFKLK
jgi:hypothetical protein